MIKPEDFDPEEELDYQDGYLFINLDETSAEYSKDEEIWVETLRDVDENIVSERDLTFEEFEAILKIRMREVGFHETSE